VLAIHRSCQRELDDLPRSVREDLADAIARLEEGHRLSMPLSRPMPSIGSGVHELRLRERSGVYRVIYVLLSKGSVALLHAFKKTTEATTRHDVEIARARLKEVMAMKSTSGSELAKRLGVSPARGMEAVMKAQLITAVLKGVESQHLTHAEVAKRAGLPRSAVTGILSGSLQKVTIDRVLKLVEAVGLVAEVRVKRAHAA
jgi:phage-related protein/predicted XRE-type DNA-binding protein